MGNSNSTPAAATLGGGAFSGNANRSDGASKLAADLKSTGSETTEKVKPCCVCKDEKARRDECMLFSKSDDPQSDCKSLVDRYRSCMKGYGFEI